MISTNRETTCNNASFKNTNESANAKHLTYFTEVIKEMVPTNLCRAYKMDKSIFEKLKPNDYTSWDREIFSKFKTNRSSSFRIIDGNLDISRSDWTFERHIWCLPRDHRLPTILTENLKFTYKHQISKHEAALVKLLTNNITIQQRFKALIKL